MNAMTNAFVNSGSVLIERNGVYIKDIIKKQPKFQEGWSLKTSYKTYQVLKHQGMAK